MSKMKIWWVFGFDVYYPGGGISDLLKTFETKEQANEYANTQYGTYDVVNVVDITEYL